MMGKRVNFAGRSVISPDPNLETSEIGVPLFVARKVTFPENVNSFNLEKLKQCIINGPTNYPGALIVEENGQRKNLEFSTLEQRIHIANSLS